MKEVIVVAKANFWRNGDGVLIEPAFASYLRDMVDDPSDNDLAEGDDESIQMPLSTLLTAPPSLPSQASVRNNWQYDLYNAVPTP